MNQQHSGNGDNIGGDKKVNNDNRTIKANKNYVESLQGSYIENQYNNYPSQPQRDQKQLDFINSYKGEIDRLLSQSLRNQIYITLDKVEDFSKVTASMQLKRAEKKAQPLPPETTIVQVFDRPDINGRLLILGDPGSGKSTNLYKLAQELVTRAKADINHPIPILFNLSSWTSNYTTIKDWLIDELKIIGVSKKLAKQYLDDGLIIPCLDGLDELPSERQTACVKAINTFLLPSNWKKPLVVCSRIKEIKLLQKKIGLNGSVILQPLNETQINQYLEDTQATNIQKLIITDKDWRDLAKTPLFLDLMVLTNKNIATEKEQNLTTKAKKLSYLFEAYLNQMIDDDFWKDQYNEEKIPKSIPSKQKILKSYLKYVGNPTQTRHYLTWLAQQLSNNKQTEFLIEKIQPRYLATPKQKRIFSLIQWLIRGLILGLVSGPIFGLIQGLIDGTIYEKTDLIISWMKNFLFIGLSIGLFMGLQDDNENKIETVETIKLNWQIFKTGLRDGLVVGIMYIVIYGLRGYSEAGMRVGLIEGLIYGLMGWLILGTIFGLTRILTKGEELEITIKPNQGIMTSVKNTLLIGGFGLFFVIVLYFMSSIMSDSLNKLREDFSGDFQRSLMLTMMMTILLTLNQGVSILQHFILRLILTFNGYSPWNYARFLDYCTEQMLLQRIGGGYRFIHRLLQEHLLEFRIK